jgi:ubiquinone/menaquinone biosynthesis C-methylase UbiE
MTLTAPTAPRIPSATDDIRNAWDAMAPRYDRFVTDEIMAFAEQALARAEIFDGSRFLDVGCGTGAVSIPAARRGADVTAIDIAPRMIELLIARAQREGFGNLKGLVMNAQALEFSDSTFEVSASLNGVSVLADLHRGLREMVRVTKPGGSVLIAASGAPRKAECLGFFMGALRAVVSHTYPSPLAVQLADANELHQQLLEAGLAEVRVEATSWDVHLASGSHFWNVVTSASPIAGQVAGDLTEGQRAQVQQVLGGMLRERSGGPPDAVLCNEMLIGIGTK